MSLIFFPMSIGFMSHVDFKKRPCCPVEFKGQGPLQKPVAVEESRPHFQTTKPIFISPLQFPLSFLSLFPKRVVTLISPCYSPKGHCLCPSSWQPPRRPLNIAPAWENLLYVVHVFLQYLLFSTQGLSCDNIELGFSYRVI